MVRGRLKLGLYESVVFDQKGFQPVVTITSAISVTMIANQPCGADGGVAIARIARQSKIMANITVSRSGSASE